MVGSFPSGLSSTIADDRPSLLVGGASASPSTLSVSHPGGDLTSWIGTEVEGPWYGGLGRYALFFVTGEGEIMPSGVKDASGHVIDEQGRVLAFWLGWDGRQQKPVLTEWEEVEPEPHWLESAEYRQARKRVGLD